MTTSSEVIEPPVISLIDYVDLMGSYEQRIHFNASTVSKCGIDFSISEILKIVELTLVKKRTMK